MRLKDFSLSLSVQTGSGAYTAYCQKGTGGVSPEVKSGRDVILTTMGSEWILG
jgi:hypothetical protein